MHGHVFYPDVLVIPDVLVNDQAQDGQGLSPAQGAQNKVQLGQGNPLYGVFTKQHSRQGCTVHR